MTKWLAVLAAFFGLIASAASICGPVAMAGPAHAAQAAAPEAVVVMYHRFGEDAIPSTSIRLDQFDAHIAHLKAGGYTVVPLSKVIAALEAGTALAPRTVAITIDDAYASVYREAWPRLRDAGFPFTLFVATDAIDSGLPGFMTWDQIRELATAGVDIGSQTASHPHMPDLDVAANRAELARSNARFTAELGAPPALIAYPYGEASLAVMDVARAAGFTAGFGQHSGGVGGTSPRFYLPRFAMNEAYGSIERFALAVDSRPLRVADVEPADVLVGQANPPDVAFTVDEAAGPLGRLACYASHEGEVALEVVGRRVRLDLRRPLPPGRSRINCTLPAGEGRWYWYGRQYYRPGA